MINTPTAGMDPEGQPITDQTHDLPGVFLTEETARTFLSELPRDLRQHYRIQGQTFIVGDWKICLWLALPIAWTPDANNFDIFYRRAYGLPDDLAAENAAIQQDDPELFDELVDLEGSA